MANIKKLRGNIVTPTGIQYGELSFGDRIIAIDAPSAPRKGEVHILPGYIDLHIHGGGGADAMEGSKALHTLSGYHGSVGTTSIMATTVTAPFPELKSIIAAIAEAQAVPDRDRRGSRVLGAHLEGPYINRAKLGAQPDFVQSFAREQLEELGLGTTTKIVTLASEALADLDDLSWLAAKGVRVQLGHSAGSYEQGCAALSAGAQGFTHLFNAMSAFHHRKPGMVGAALAHATYSELIADGVHVHEGAIQVALRAIPKLYCVSDATAAAGMPDGAFKLGDHTVQKCPNGVYLPDGTLAGSSSCMHDALLTMLAIDGDLPKAVDRVATYPADYIGRMDLGRLHPGCMADMVVLGADRSIIDVYLGGNLL